jgi:hypothetical protein
MGPHFSAPGRNANGNARGSIGEGHHLNRSRGDISELAAIVRVRRPV